MVSILNERACKEQRTENTKKRGHAVLGRFRKVFKEEVTSVPPPEK